MYSIGQHKRIPPAFNGQQPIKRDKAVTFTGDPVVETAKHVLQKSGLERMGENLAGKFSDKALQSGWFKKFLDFSVQANKNASWFEACMVLGLATTIRPVSIMGMPAKKDDKQYAAAKSIATGIIGFAVAALIYLPLAAVMKKSGEAAKKLLETNAGKGIFPAIGTKAYDSFNFIINYGSKFIVGPLDAMLLFKLIPPIMHKVFPERYKKKGDQPNPLPVMAANLNEDQQKVFAALMQKSGTGVK